MPSSQGSGPPNYTALEEAQGHGDLGHVLLFSLAGEEKRHEEKGTDLQVCKWL